GGAARCRYRTRPEPRSRTRTGRWLPRVTRLAFVAVGSNQRHPRARPGERGYPDVHGVVVADLGGHRVRLRHDRAAAHGHIGPVRADHDIVVERANERDYATVRLR